MLKVALADYQDPQDAQAVVTLLDGYASEPSGGGQALAPEVKARLVAEMAARPNLFSVLAWAGEGSARQAIGLINCVEGFSTFAARALINVHDVVVLASHRRQGVAQAMEAFRADDYHLAVATGKARRGLDRVLKAHGQTAHRGRAKAPKQRRPPTTHLATEPRQV